MNDLLDTVNGYNLGEPGGFAAAAGKLLAALDVDRPALRALVQDAAANPDLVWLCEHCWSDTSRILSGSDAHTDYGGDEHLDHSAGPVDAAALKLPVLRTEQPDHTSTLHHNLLRSLTAQPYATTLAVRRPTGRDWFLFTDQGTGRVRRRRGTATEPPGERARKRMTVDRVRAVIDPLSGLEVLPHAATSAGGRRSPGVGVSGRG